MRQKNKVRINFFSVNTFSYHKKITKIKWRLYCSECILIVMFWHFTVERNGSSSPCGIVYRSRYSKPENKTNKQAKPKPKQAKERTKQQQTPQKSGRKHRLVIKALVLNSKEPYRKQPMEDFIKPCQKTHTQLQREGKCSFHNYNLLNFGNVSPFLILYFKCL